MTQKILQIIGAGFEQVPAIKMAKTMGYKVVVTDCNPQAPGAILADVFAQISTHDKTGNLEFARAQKIDGVMTLGAELAVPVVAFVAEHLCLPGLSSATALKATNKNAMRQAFESLSVPTPSSQKVNNLVALEDFVKLHGWPIVIKPSDSSGQRGVGIYQSDADLSAALTEALQYSTDNSAIVEKFVTGPEINVTAVVQGGEVEFLSFSHRIIADSPHFGIALKHVAPTNLTQAALESVKQVSFLAIKAIGLDNGIAYPQVISSQNGAQVIEIAARIPGGYMRDVALLQSGVDMVEVAILQAMGTPLAIKKYKKYPRYPVVIVKFLTELDLLPNQKTLHKVGSFEKNSTRPGVYLSYCSLKKGDKIPALTSSAGRFGAIITYAQTLAEAQNVLNQVLASVDLK